MNLDPTDTSYQPPPTSTQLHYTIANISLHKLYQTARGSSLCLRQHVLIRNLLMCGSFDMILNPAPLNKPAAQITTVSSSTTPPSGEDVWLERCFDDLTDADDDMEEDDDVRTDDASDKLVAAVPNSTSWLFASNYRRHETEQDNALVPSLKIPQQVFLVIPFSQLRDTIASKEAAAVGSIVAPDDPACSSKNVSKEKIQHNAPIALIEWNGGSWPMY